MLLGQPIAAAVWPDRAAGVSPHTLEASDFDAAGTTLHEHGRVLQQDTVRSRSHVCARAAVLLRFPSTPATARALQLQTTPAQPSQIRVLTACVSRAGWRL